MPKRVFKRTRVVSKETRKKMSASMMGKNTGIKKRVIREGRPLHYIGDGRYTYEARIIMRKALCRELSGKELVHHKNHNPLDNHIDNLEILTREEHARLHGKEKNNLSDFIKRRAKKHRSLT